jgi:methionine-S-sulfoxide reductase
MISKILQGVLPVCAFFSIDGSAVGGNAYSSAVFAGGCFWCIEAAFESVDGVVSAESGYTGGKMKNPTYDEVSTGLTGHYEAVRVTYDSSKIKYDQLLNIFWRQIDPTDDGGQFADRGSQYRTAIFFSDEAQRSAAQKSLNELAASGVFDRPIATKILPVSAFYMAEGYHQNYCRIAPEAYSRYKRGSGREGFIEKVWGETK